MSQLDRSKYSSEEEDVLRIPLQSEGESQEHIEHHGEKKSVLKKVKAKAKKIKDSIKGHVGHGHDHGEHSYDEEDDDDDEEMYTDPEIHGYQTTQTYIIVQQGGPTNQRGYSSMEGVTTHAPPMSSTGASEPSNTEYIPGTLLPVSAPANPPPEYQTFDPRTTSYVPGQGDTLSHSRTDTGMQTGFGKEYASPNNTPVATAACNRNMDEFDRGKARELKREAFDFSRGGTHGTDARGIGSALDKGTMLEKDPHAPKPISEDLMPERYQEKVSDPSGMGSEEMGMISPVLHQVEKMKIHGSESDDGQETGQEETMFKPSMDRGMAPSFVASDEKQETGQEEESLLKSSSESDLVPSMGSHDQFSAETITPSFVHQPEAQTGFSDATRGSDMSSQDQQSYTEKISAAASTVADKAKQATGAVTSKLGYGGTTEEQNTLQSDQGEGYGEKISNVASAIADKAVHAKDAVATTLAEMGSTVASKVPSVASKVQSSGKETEGVRPSERGVSMKEYLVEKLKPGEEEKALSEVISEALPLHKAKDESEVGTKASVKVRVTESDEVKKRLGEFDEKSLENAGGSGSASPGRVVLDRIYDAATSWFGKGGETQPVSKSFKDNPDNPEGNVADPTP